MLSFSKIKDSFKKWTQPDEFNIFDPETTDEYDAEEMDDKSEMYCSCPVTTNPSIMVSNTFSSRKENNIRVKGEMKCFLGKVDASTMTMPGIWLSHVNETKCNLNKNSTFNYEIDSSSESFWFKYYIYTFWHLNTFKILKYWKFSDTISSYITCFTNFVPKYGFRSMHSTIIGILDIFFFAVFLISVYIYEIFQKYFKYLLQKRNSLKSNDVPESVKLYVQKVIFEALKGVTIKKDRNIASKQPFSEFSNNKNSTPKHIKKLNFKYANKIGNNVKYKKHIILSPQVYKHAKLLEIFVKRKQEKANKFCLHKPNPSCNFNNKYFLYRNYKKCGLSSKENFFFENAESTKNDSSFDNSLLSPLSNSEIKSLDDTEFELYFSDRNHGINGLEDVCQCKNEFTANISDINSTPESYEKTCSNNACHAWNDSYNFNMNSSMKRSDFFNLKPHDPYADDGACHENRYFGLHDSSLDGECYDDNNDMKSPPKKDISSFLNDCFNKWDCANESNEGVYGGTTSIDETSYNASDTINTSVETNNDTSTTAESSEISITSTFDKWYLESNAVNHRYDNYEGTGISQSKQCSYQKQNTDDLVNYVSFNSNDTIDLSLEETKPAETRSVLNITSTNFADGNEENEAFNIVSKDNEKSVMDVNTNCIALHSFDSNFRTEFSDDTRAFISKNKSPVTLKAFHNGSTKVSPKMPSMLKNLKKLQAYYGINILKFGSPYRKYQSEI